MSKSERTAIRAWRNFVRAKSETSRAFDRELREHRLTGAQLGILRVIADSGNEGVKLNEISHRLYVTSGNVTGLIDRLEEAGYLARVAHPEDRRSTLAVLTPAGQALFEQIYPVHIARVQELMSVITESERAMLADLLAKVADQAREMAR